MFKPNNNEVVGSGTSRTNKMVVNLSKNNKSRNLICISNIRATKKFIFLISNSKKIFNHLWLVFIEIPIF